MDGRRILELKKFDTNSFHKVDQNKLKLFIDSRSLSESFDKNSKIKIFLSYKTTQHFDFIRSPYQTIRDEINTINYFSNDKVNNYGVIRYHIDTTIIGHSVTPLVNIEIIGKEIFKKDSITQDEWDQIWLIFVQASFIEHDHRTIFVTENEILLKNRRWFEEHVPGGQLNIANVSEAMEIMDLFAKKRNKYHIADIYYANKGLWYLTSFRNKVPYFHFETDMLNSFCRRFEFLLKCVDEIGMQFFLGVNNDTEDDTMYNFNYFISLITGIFDNLALETKNRLNIIFKGDDIPWKISLNKKAGEDFLDALKQKNPDLRQHITTNADFINLIYQLRDVIIHREGVKTIQYGSWFGTRSDEYIFVKISKELFDLINRLGDKMKKYDPVSEWGVHKDVLGYKMSPYDFAKSATLRLSEFSNIYLKLLGFQNYFTNKNTDDSKRNEAFESCRLGF